MKLKDQKLFTEYTFDMVDPDGVNITVPSNGRKAPNLRVLINTVLSVVNAYDNATENRFSKRQRELAMEYGVEFERYMGVVVEEQLCMKHPSECWKTGAGDWVHAAFSKVDDWKKAHAPKMLRKVLDKVARVVTPDKTSDFKGCRSCGGSKRMVASQDNLGRRGKLNKKLGGS